MSGTSDKLPTAALLSAERERDKAQTVWGYEAKKLAWRAKRTSYRREGTERPSASC